MTPNKRIGILSGTFDPIHQGHVNLAQAALKHLKLHQVWVMVDAYPQGKPTVTDFEHRHAMAKLAVASTPGVTADQEPMQREARSHGLDTALALTGTYPDCDFVLLMGQDTFIRIDQWNGIEEMIKLLAFGVAARSGTPEAAQQEMRARLGDLERELKLETIPMDLLELSSSSIRSAFAADQSSAGLDPEVEDYIRKHNLF